MRPGSELDLSLSPTWSPDGARIAFSRVDASPPSDIAGGIYVMDADGSGASRLPNSIAGDGQPAWSPDGDSIAVARSISPAAPTDVYLLDADGTGVTALTSDPARDGGPNWSPDGSKIAFYSDRDGDFEIYVLNAANGSGLTKLTDNASVDITPAWSPDGSRIVFAGIGIGGALDLFVVPATGGAAVNITNTSGSDLGGGSESFPDWQPLVGPRRQDFKNASAFCKSQRAFLGESAFRAQYGGSRNALGKCVSAR